MLSTILEKLIRASARYDAYDTPLECMTGTRVELLDSLISQVKAGAQTAPKVILVCGIPGSGKSTIAKTIAMRLAREDLLAASFFFSRNHTTRSQLKLVFSTIAFQLAQYSAEFARHLSEILEKDSELVNVGPSAQLNKLVLEPLSQVAPLGNQPWIIVLDALDECGSDHGDALLELLTTHIGRFPSFMRFLITGRPEDPIQSTFTNPTFQPITHIHTLHEMPEPIVSEDIRRYVTQSLGGDWRGRGKWRPKIDDIDALVMRANNLFIFAATAVKFIRDNSRRLDPQSPMDFILHTVDASGPRLLDQLYFEIVNNAVPPPRNSLDHDWLAQYQRVLGAVIYLQEPLSAAAIAGLVGIENDEVSRVVSLFSSVLTVSGNHGEGTVRVAHLSFRKYVTGSIEENRKDLLLVDATHHGVLANDCIKHMNEKLHCNICNLKVSDTYALNTKIRRLKNKAAFHIPQSLRYACTYWTSHLPASEHIDVDALEKWLNNNILFWLEVLSICGQLSRAPSLIADAQRWSQDNVCKSCYVCQYQCLVCAYCPFYRMTRLLGQISHVSILFSLT